MDARYVIIWFEDDDVYTLVDEHGAPVYLSPTEVLDEGIPVLFTEREVDKADNDIRYAISPDLLEDLFGWDQNA